MKNALTQIKIEGIHKLAVGKLMCNISLKVHYVLFNNYFSIREFKDLLINIMRILQSFEFN